MRNKLLCTFTSIEGMEQTIANIVKSYEILYDKVFILKTLNSDEYLCTYNVELGNVNSFIDNTVLVHRKKETNTLYTINALNILIESLNDGYLDKQYQVKWEDYRNTALLTKGPSLHKLETSLYKIIHL